MKKNMSGVELIAQERREQIEKHDRTIIDDVLTNDQCQLSEAASILASDEWGCNTAEDMIEDHCPTGWSKVIWAKMVNKDYYDRLIIAGALIAAEIDRMNAEANELSENSFY